MKDLKKFIKEYISMNRKNLSLISESSSWTDTDGDLVARELYDSILLGSYQSWTRKLEKDIVNIIEINFPEIKAQSNENLQGKILYRGLGVDEKLEEKIMREGLPGRDKLSSWTTDPNIASRFAGRGPGRSPLLLNIPSNIAAPHMVVDFDTYFSAFPGYNADSHMMEEHEILLKDFLVEPQYIKKLR